MSVSAPPPPGRDPDAPLRLPGSRPWGNEAGAAAKLDVLAQPPDPQAPDPSSRYRPVPGGAPMTEYRGDRGIVRWKRL